MTAPITATHRPPSPSLHGTAWRRLAATLLALAGLAPAWAQQALPRMQSSTGVVSIQVGERLHKNNWQLSPETNPDVYEVPLPNSKPLTVKFISRVDALSFLVEDGKSYDFIIQHNGKDSHTRVTGKGFVPPKGLELVFDFEFAKAAANLVQAGDFSDAALQPLKALPAANALQRKLRLTDFAQLGKHFREAYGKPKAKEGAGLVLDEFAKGGAGKYASLAAQVTQALEAYVPPDLGARVTVYFIFGGTSNGFAFGGDDVYVNLAAYTDASAQDIAETVAHEVFHAIQSHVMGGSPSNSGEAAKEEPVWAQSLLYSLLQEATAEVFTHSLQAQPQTKVAREQKERIEKNMARMRGLFAMFETLVFRLTYAPPTDAQEYDRIYGLMFYNAFDASAYDMGWLMVNAIEQKHGKAVVFDLLRHDPKEFILRYQAIAEVDKQLPRFSEPFIKLVRERL